LPKKIKVRIQIIKQTGEIIMSAENSKGTGIRHNEGKLRLDLIPPFATKEIGRVFTTGAGKYPERNWEKGMKWTTVIASLKRHLLEFELGEDMDPETGHYHMAHLATNAMFLLEYYKIYPEGDDRPRKYSKL
jgi:hypothetical protein